MANGPGPSSLTKSSTTAFDYDNDFDPPPMDDADYSQANHADDDGKSEVEVDTPPKKPDKGKRRADPEEPDDVEEEIARGLEDVVEDEEEVPVKKKPREEKAKKPGGRPAKRVLLAPERK